MSGHLDGPPPGPPDPPYIPGDLGAPSAEEFARRRGQAATFDPRHPHEPEIPPAPDAADLVAAHLRERWPCTCRPGMDGGGVHHAADCNSRREGSQAVLAVIRLLRAATPPASPDERLREAGDRLAALIVEETDGIGRFWYEIGPGWREVEEALKGWAALAATDREENTDG